MSEKQCQKAAGDEIIEFSNDQFFFKPVLKSVSKYMPKILVTIIKPVKTKIIFYHESVAC